MSYWTGVGAGKLRCCQQTNRNFLKSLRGSLAMGKPSEVVALNMIILNVLSCTEFEEVKMQLVNDLVILLFFAGICGLLNWALALPYEHYLAREKGPNTSLVEYVRPAVAFWTILIISVACVWQSWNLLGLPIPEFIQNEIL